ncbi:MAG: hypothetical protein ACLFV2_03500, partial [Desulfurivibrionaceae bacterium]
LGLAFVVSLFLVVVIFSLSVAIVSRQDAVKVINSVVYRFTGRYILPESLSRSARKSSGDKGKKAERKEESGVEENLEEGGEEPWKQYLDRKLRPLRDSGERLSEEISLLKSKSGKLFSEIKGLKKEGSRVAGLEEGMSELRSDISDLQQKMEDDIEGLRKELEETKEQLAEAAATQTRKKVGGKAQESEPAEGKHRIFDYLSRKTDRRKLTELVEKTVEQEMSYAEAMEYITSNMPAEAAEVVEAHPSLTREYIKSCRELAGK